MDREAFAAQMREHCGADQRTDAGNSEQGLYGLEIAHADLQLAVALNDLRYAVVGDGVLNFGKHSMLVDVEKEAVFQRRTLDACRCGGNRERHASFQCPSPPAPPTLVTQKRG